MRQTSRMRWSALHDDAVIGTASVLIRPDRRCQLAIDTSSSDVFDELLATVGTELHQRLQVTVDETDGDNLARWQGAGFQIARRETLYDVPTDPAATGLSNAPLPTGLSVVAADEVNESQLRALDDELRQDVPGSDGWYNDPQEFSDYTFDAQQFDPTTYLVAVKDVGHMFAGLVRVWANAHPRLGLVGVTRGYRRQGLARAMLAVVLGRLHERGTSTVAAEVDSTNVASNALLSGIGGRRTGGTLELARHSECC